MSQVRRPGDRMGCRTRTREGLRDGRGFQPEPEGLAPGGVPVLVMVLWLYQQKKLTFMEDEGNDSENIILKRRCQYELI